MIAYLEPRTRVGDFEFNCLIESVISQFEFSHYTPKGEDYEVYEIEGHKTSIYVEEGLITSINCKEECLYKGRNMIGMEIDDFLNYYGWEPDDEPDELDFEEDDIPQYVYDFDEPDLQVWTKDGIIVTVIASNYIEEEDD